jgi:hypothetical protein
VLGIGRDCQHGLGRGPEQQIVDYRFVVIGDGSDTGRQREDHVEVGHGQELGLAFGEPLLCRRLPCFSVCLAGSSENKAFGISPLAACALENHLGCTPPVGGTTFCSAS